MFVLETTCNMSKNALERVLLALADPTRRQALVQLHVTDELCVCELMRNLGVTQSRMSRHMSALKAAGLVLDRRDAQWVRYRRNRDVPAEIAAVVQSILAATSKLPEQRSRSLSARTKDRATL